ncbi:MAG TPA: hypothetical protein PLO50_07330, partial [Nitrospira sp.]|nr:hypothetical protein [Nitrospira sp.]
LYLRRTESGCQVGPKVYPWNDVTGVGETPNKAAADFEEKWKAKGLTANMYSGPSWEGGIKPEKPAPPKPAAPPKAATPPPPPAAPAGTVSTPPAPPVAGTTTPEAVSTSTDTAPIATPASTISPST